MSDRVFVDSCLTAINDFRQKHQVSSLTLNSSLTTVAQRWAQQLARTGSSLRHNPDASYKGEPLGENCAVKWCSTHQDFTGREVADQWYGEVKNYDFRRHSGNNTGHFTQLVWKSSREIGIGRAQSRDGKWFVVANFYPAGNYVGRHTENVFTPRDVKIVLPVSTRDSSPSLSRMQFASGTEKTEPLSTSGRSYQQYTPGGDTAAVQRRQKTQTVGGVTKTIVTEIRRDRDGHMTTTTTETTSRDGDYTSGLRDTTNRAAYFGLTESRGFTVTSSPKSTRHQGAPTAFNPRGAAAATATSSSSGGSSSPNDKDFVVQVVKQHNVYRKLHGNVGDLTLNRDLCKSAEKWAAQLASTKTLQHNKTTFKDQPVGQNIAYKYSSAKEGFSGDEFVKMWYSELSLVNFKNVEAAANGAGHFTQVVWKGSREVGVGRAFADNGERVYVVCNYFPAGNIIGTFKDNVFSAQK